MEWEQSMPYSQARPLVLRTEQIWPEFSGDAKLEMMLLASIVVISCDVRHFAYLCVYLFCCQSLTNTYCVKTAKHIVIIISPASSTVILVCFEISIFLFRNQHFLCWSWNLLYYCMVKLWMKFYLLKHIGTIRKFIWPRLKIYKFKMADWVMQNFVETLKVNDSWRTKFYFSKLDCGQPVCLWLLYKIYLFFSKNDQLW